MLDDNNSNDQSGGATDDHESDDGGADKSNSQSDSDKSKDSKKDDVVPKTVAERFKKDMLKWKDLAKKNESQLAEVREQLELSKSKGDNGDPDYKSIAERFKTEATEAKTKAKELQENIVYSSKFDAVYRELKKLGLRDDAERYLEYEDLKDLEFETTSKGRVNVLGAKEWASEWQEKNKVLFEPKKSAKVSSSDGRSGTNLESDKITPAMVVEAESKASRTRKPEDIRLYKEVLDKYQKQRARRA